MTDQTRSTADEEIMRLATADDDGGEATPAAKADDTLELGSEEAPVATPEQIEAEKEKNRSRHPSQRIAHYRAIAGEAERRAEAAERRAAELEGRTAAPAKADEPAAPDPNDAKYEFGEADPQYIKDSALFEVRKEIADERRKEHEAAEAQGKHANVVSKITDGMANIEKTGAEKYEDFEAKIGDAVEARGGEPLPPLLSIGIAVSPVGADIAYKLATDEAASAKLEKLATTSPQAAAVAFGELEGEFVENDDDLDLSDHMDMARMLGRMKARLAGKGGQSPVERKQTKAPNPAEHRARGGTGQFEVGDDTEDFAAFERKYMGKKK